MDSLCLTGQTKLNSIMYNSMELKNSSIDEFLFSNFLG